jgi:hypothetical protein
MALPTYRQIGEHYGVTLVDCPRMHSNPSRGIVDFPLDKKSTKRGIRQFLMLVADIRLSLNRGQPEWHRIWYRNIWAQREALETWRMRLPVEYSKNDRLRVLERTRSATYVPAAVLRWAQEWRS